jgi:hypothetical protein
MLARSQSNLGITAIRPHNYHQSRNLHQAKPLMPSHKISGRNRCRMEKSRTPVAGSLYFPKPPQNANDAAWELRYENGEGKLRLPLPQINEPLRFERRRYLRCGGSDRQRPHSKIQYCKGERK